MTTLNPPKQLHSDSESDTSDFDDYGVKQSLFEEERTRIEAELKRHEEELKTTPYKVLIVGDPGVGKAALLADIRARAVAAGVEQPPADSSHPQASLVKYVLHSQAEHVQFENLTKPTIFFQNAGNAGSNDSNPSSDPYKDADAILLCFSARDRSSLDSVESKWIRVLNQSCPEIPSTLVGLPGDSGAATSSTSSDAHAKIEVKPSLARKVSRKIGSQAYIDCTGSVTKEDHIPKLLQQCASDARYGRLIRRRNVTGTHAREGDALPERIMLYTVGALATGPALIFGGIAIAGSTALGVKPMVRKIRERKERSKMAKTQADA